MNTTNQREINRLTSEVRRIATEKGLKVSINTKSKSIKVYCAEGYFMEPKLVVQFNWGRWALTNQIQALKATSTCLWSSF